MLKSINSVESNFYAQFIPICSDKNTLLLMNIQFLLMIEILGLMYILLIPKKQFENYLTSEKFNFYTDDGCFGKSYT